MNLAEFKGMLVLMVSYQLGASSYSRTNYPPPDNGLK